MRSSSVAKLRGNDFLHTVLTAFVLCAAAVSIAMPLVGPDEKLPSIDKLFAARDTTATPGLALAVIRGGPIIYKRGYDMARFEDGVVWVRTKGST